MSSILAENKWDSCSDLAKLPWKSFQDASLNSDATNSEILNPFIYLAEKAKAIPYIDKIVELYEDKVMHIFFVYQERKRDEQKKVYDLQLHFMQTFRNYSFAFHDVVSGEQPLSALMSGKSLALIYER